MLVKQSLVLALLAALLVGCSLAQPAPQSQQANSLPVTTTTIATTSRLISNEDEKVEDTTVIGEPLNVNADVNPSTTLAVDTSDSSSPTTPIADMPDSVETTTTTPPSAKATTTTTLVASKSVDDEPTLPPDFEPKSISKDDDGLNSANNNKNDDDSNLKTTDNATDDADEHTAKSNAHPMKFAKTRQFPKLNMTKVDWLFNEATKSPQESADLWHALQQKSRKAIGQLIGSVVPFALNVSSEAGLSSNCSGAFLKWILSMNQLKAWSMRMLDASGKPSAGLLEGSMTMFGNHRECLKVRAPDDDEIEFAEGAFKEYFRGKYCIIQAKPWLPKKDRFYNLNSKLKQVLETDESNEWYDKTIFEEFADWFLSFNFVSIRYDLCVPSVCTREDLQRVINYLLPNVDIRARVLRCETDASDKPWLGNSIEIESSPQTSLSTNELASGSSSNSIDNGENSITTIRSLLTPNYLASSNDQQQLEAKKRNRLIIWLALPLATISLVLLSTLISIFMNLRTKNKFSLQTIDNNNSTTQQKVTNSQTTINSKNNKNLDYTNNEDKLGNGISPKNFDFINSRRIINNDESTEDRTKSRRISRLAHTIESLSLPKSVDCHVKLDYEQIADDKPLALYGIRFILVLWVIIVDSAVNLRFEFLRELLMLKDLIFWWPMQIIINSSLQFDSLILLTAFVMGYKNCLNEQLTSVKNIAKYILDKYIRLMPSIMIMVSITILLPLIYQGPVWNDYVIQQSNICQSTGVINILFLQNYLNYKEICLPHTWLFCVELQLVILTAPILYYLNKNYLRGSASLTSKTNLQTNIGNSDTTLDSGKSMKSLILTAEKPLYWASTMPGLALIVCIVFGLTASFYNVFVRELPPTWYYTIADPDSKALYFGDHFTKLWTHLAVFSIGLLAGIEFKRSYQRRLQCKTYKCDNSSRVETLCSSMSLCNSSSTFSVAIGNSHDNSRLNQYSKSANNIYDVAEQKNNAQNRNNVQISIEASKFESKRASSFYKRAINIIGATITIAIMCMIIFSTHSWSISDMPQPAIAGAFDAFSRLVWSLAFVYILYNVAVPNSNGEFSLLARLLGHPIMVALGKLSFLIYMIHPLVHTVVLAIQEQPIYSNWLMLFHMLLGNITITVILSAFVSIFIEMPCRNLFKRCRTSFLLAE